MHRAPCAGTLRGSPGTWGRRPPAPLVIMTPTAPGPPTRDLSPSLLPRQRLGGPVSLWQPGQASGWAPECVTGGGRWAWRASEVPLVRDTLGHLVVTTSPREQLSSECTLPEGPGASLARLKTSTDPGMGQRGQGCGRGPAADRPGSLGGRSGRTGVRPGGRDCGPHPCRRMGRQGTAQRRVGWNV